MNQSTAAASALDWCTEHQYADSMRKLWRAMLEELRTMWKRMTCDHDMQPIDGEWEFRCTKCGMQSSVIR